MDAGGGGGSPGPTLVRNAGWFGPVVTRFPTLRREVWLTIDDGPDPVETPAILDVLARHGAQATFFTIGEKVDRWPDLARAVVAAGHRVENHTFRHRAASYWAALPPHAGREIERGSAAIARAVGTAPTSFRAPAGLANPFVHAACERAGLRMIGWSASGNDGIAHDPERVVAKILRAVRPGAIILLHEGPLKGLAPGTRARTLEAVLLGLAAQGYRTVIPTLPNDDRQG